MGRVRVRVRVSVRVRARARVRVRVSVRVRVGRHARAVPSVEEETSVALSGDSTSSVISPD